MSPRLLLGLAAASLAASPGLASVDEAGVVTLTPQERQTAGEAAAASAARELPINGIDRAPHGEIGMEIGTGGYRAAYGSATVPLGQNGSATVAFATGRMGRVRLR